MSWFVPRLRDGEAVLRLVATGNNGTGCTIVGSEANTLSRVT